MRASADVARQEERNHERVEENPIRRAGTIHFAERHPGQGKSARQGNFFAPFTSEHILTPTGLFFLCPHTACILIFFEHRALLPGIHQLQSWLQLHQRPCEQNLSESRVPQPAPEPPQSWPSTMIHEDGS
jgi:hypothetical protein